MNFRGFKSWLKKLISSNVYLYVVWFYGIRRYKGDYVRLPSNEDDFYFDGYPRSGNTFFTGLLKKVYADKSFAHHLHIISGLKIALKLKLPIFVIIREPKDAVVSYLYRKVSKKDMAPDQFLIEDLLISYYSYYKFVYKHINSLNILEFNSCIKNELSVIRKVAEVANFEVKADKQLQEILQSFHRLMKKKEEEKKSHASSLPNDHRKAFKKEYLNKVINSPAYSRTEYIYNELTEYDLLSEE